MKYKILAIDDDEKILRLIANALKRTIFTWKLVKYRGRSISVTLLDSI